MRNARWRPLAVLGALVALTATASAATYTVRPGDTLSEIAGDLGTSVTALVGVNDLADPDRILAGQVLNIPGGGGPDAAPAPRHHVVRPGETLSAIASRYDLSVDALAAANGIVDPNRVLAGSRLTIAEAPATGGTGAAPAAAPAGDGSHVVQAGETLSGIATAFGISVADLAAANGIDDPDRIVAGARLTIPGGWHCPVQGSLSFANDYGVPKSDGRFHEGVDVFADRGTPVVAPVSGRAEHIEGSRGGLQVWLHGDDGDLYIATHLDTFGAGGHVSAGTQIGTVGTSGNAAGTSPHVHFEHHPGDGPAANPFPLLLDHCR